MADPIFALPRLAAIYDALDGDRTDLEAYIAIADELGARSVLDVGCGTGTFALALASRGTTVVGIDPARASLEVARGKPGSERVRWIHGDATTLPPELRGMDLASMTANVAQAIVEPGDWDATLRGVHAALRPGGHLVFETRDPADRAWERWTRAESWRAVEVAGVGAVETWIDVLEVRGPLVRFRHTWEFAADADVLTSHSTLRFREQAEVEASLDRCGFALVDVRGAPDRPGRELVFLAARED